MTSQIIACRQGADNAITRGEFNNSWTNVFKQPVKLEEGSTIRVNYVFLNTNAKSDLIKIVEGVNNVFKIKINYYYHRELWTINSTDTGPMTLAPIYLSNEEGDNIYDNTVEYTIPTGYYTVDQISDRLNALMVASEPRTLYINENGAVSTDFNDGNWRIVTFESDFFKSFYSSTGYSLNQISNANNEAEWPSSIYNGSNYMCQTGANTPQFIYSPQQSRFTFQNLHFNYVGADSQPAVLVNGNIKVNDSDQTHLPSYVSRLGGCWITLMDDDASGWSTLGFDSTQIGSYLNGVGTTDAQLQAGFTTSPGLPAPQASFQQNSTTLSANNLPIQSNNPYWLLQTDLISSTNYLNPEQQGLISCSGVISANYNQGGYVYSYENSFDIPFKETKTITSIKTTILDGNGEPPAENTLLTNSSVLYEVIPPPQML